MIRWRMHTERPTEKAMPALIALKDDGGGWFLASAIYVWIDGKWVREDDEDLELDRTEFCWLPETELIASLEGGLK
jgi:hypothetical protein